MDELAGMTVNERLFHKGLMEEFDRAVRTVDVTSLRGLLKRIDLDEQHIVEVIRSYLPFLSEATIRSIQHPEP